MTPPPDNDPPPFQDCTALVTVQSSLSTPPSCQVWRVTPSPTPGEVHLLPAGLILEPCSFEPPRWLPQLHSCRLRASGEQLHALVYPPAGYVPGRRYPTVVNVYGGPQVQVVTNTFKVRLGGGEREFGSVVVVGWGVGRQLQLTCMWGVIVMMMTTVDPTRQ